MQGLNYNGLPTAMPVAGSTQPSDGTAAQQQQQQQQQQQMQVQDQTQQMGIFAAQTSNAASSGFAASSGHMGPAGLYEQGGAHADVLMMSTMDTTTPTQTPMPRPDPSLDSASYGSAYNADHVPSTQQQPHLQMQQQQQQQQQQQHVNVSSQMSQQPATKPVQFTSTPPLPYQQQPQAVQLPGQSQPASQHVYQDSQNALAIQASPAVAAPAKDYMPPTLQNMQKAQGQTFRAGQNSANNVIAEALPLPDGQHRDEHHMQAPPAVPNSLLPAFTASGPTDNASWAAMSAGAQLTQEQLANAQNQDVALKACADVANSYNKIANLLANRSIVDVATRVAIRQDFCNAVAALDRAFFLSPEGPGYIGSQQDEGMGPRKRAHTVNSADGADSNKHRRTVSVASDARSELSSSMRSPFSGSPANASRPPLGQHTHSSPLLPVENHYRPTPSGLSDPIPAPKASDLAASGSHHVGRPTPLYQSTLASDSAMSEGISQTGSPTGSHNFLPNIQAHLFQSSQNILAPTPMPAGSAMMDGTALAGQLATDGAFGADDLQTSFGQTQPFLSEGVDPSQMQVQSSTTPTPQQQHAYITPPMESMAPFQSQPGMPFQDNDAPKTSNATFANATVPPPPAPTPTASLQPSGTMSSRPTTRAGHPGSLDFTSLRAKDDESGTTSPYASSHLSMSSFPFSNSVGGQTSGSRSRATSLSRNTSASRSRAPSINSMHYSITHGPDAQELHNILGSLKAMPSPINEDDHDDDDDQTNSSDGPLLSKRDVLSAELSAKYAQIFSTWLPKVCANTELTDRKGEKIHQPLMAKKMAKLDEEHAWRPFKFRIQPFTNSFQDACREAGLSEAETAPKYIKHFLWNQPLISRFNDEGKKTKSRGNHVWSVDARLVSAGLYEYRPPAPKIVPLPATAAPNMHWTWAPKVLDSSCQGGPMDATFSCPRLPTWLSFDDDVLQGTPPLDAHSVKLDIVAEYAGHTLVQTFTIALVTEEGVRPIAHDSPPDESVRQSAHGSTAHTPISDGKGHHGNYSGSSLSSDLTHSTNSIITPPALVNHGAQGTALLPSPLPAYAHDMTTQRISSMYPVGKVNPALASVAQTSPSSPSSPAYLNSGMGQPVPFFLPTHPTDATTLASANHIKAKLVETTALHHENMSALNPAHPPPDAAKISAAVENAISRQIVASAPQHHVPSAHEVFNATLEVSTRSQQMQHEQLSQAVAAVTQAISQQPLMSSQVTNQLASFSFTPSNTPGIRSPESSFTANANGT